MPGTPIIQDWQGRVAGRFPGLPAPTCSALALAALGMAQARSGLLNTPLLTRAGTAGATSNALRQPLRAFPKDEAFGPAVRFAPPAVAGITPSPTLRVLGVRNRGEPTPPA